MIDKFSAEDFNIFSIASVSPELELGNPKKNVEFILEVLFSDKIRESRFVVFPELCITGYSCGDLFFQNNLISEARKALVELKDALKGDDRLIAVGLPLLFEDRLYNCAAIISNGVIRGIVPKINIPNYQEFYEKRWFYSGRDIQNRKIRIGGKETDFGTNLLFSHCGVKIGIEICEDLWVPGPPSSRLCEAGAEIILNLSATDDNIGKYEYIKSLVSSQSGRCRCAYAYASAGFGESSTDLVFSGINLIAADGTVLNASDRFSGKASFAKASVDIEKLRNDRRKYSTFFQGHSSTESEIKILANEGSHGLQKKYPELVADPTPFIPSDFERRKENCGEIVSIQSWGLNRRMNAARTENIVVGISGGLDSTLALLVAHHTFIKSGRDTKNITGITMPSAATSGRTKNNATHLMEELGVTSLEIPIGEAVGRHFQDIGHDPSVYDAVYENSQARERTQILMDMANKYNGLVLGTGDMSELALGWCTYNGDHMSMYNVNSGVPKTLVKYLVQWFADKAESEDLKKTLTDIIDTPISPELIPSTSPGEEIAQKTEDIIGPYELHDFFLFHVIRNGFSPSKIFYLANLAFSDRYDKSVLKKWLVNFYRRFFSQQFKRSCMPDGPKVGSVCLSPRGDWRMPSDASATLWQKEAESINIE